MKPVLPCAVMIMVVLFGVPGYTAERLVPYDDFNAASIHPNQWFGGEYSPFYPGGSAEAIRQIQNHRLRLVYRGYGRTDSNGGRLRSQLALMFRHPAAVTAIQATVQVTDAASTDCPANPERTAALAMIGGRFFGGPPSTPDGAVRDMVASIGLFRLAGMSDPSDLLRVRSSVFYCADRPCTTGMELAWRDFGTVKLGENARLRVQWDRENHRFIFQRDDDPEAFVPYAVADTDPPIRPKPNTRVTSRKLARGTRAVKRSRVLPCG